MKVLLAVALLAVIAQVPSCEQEDRGPLVGFVEDKYIVSTGMGAGKPAIVIQAAEYIVPWDFYREVQVGDLVKYENGQWIIVRKASGSRTAPPVVTT
ncbi:MAG: hypothetical protein QN173_01200 [Armatimonadota bacterium]|nr:hypothetical protein [Armatimonadota bacterium]MDR7401469.1 hypothetical protein [Armatimonadota bacterium]MDR7437195.1 hypothetical protein [Armatimonadota bacterium]MDR7472995.1 hypothetical protein [Armatimonadota bacterium]MDR7506207.1 hypothetical protein [Armatimonadota bacterium]